MLLKKQHKEDIERITVLETQNGRLEIDKSELKKDLDLQKEVSKNSASQISTLSEDLRKLKAELESSNLRCTQLEEESLKAANSSSSSKATDEEVFLFLFINKKELTLL